LSGNHWYDTPHEKFAMPDPHPDPEGHYVCPTNNTLGETNRFLSVNSPELIFHLLLLGLGLNKWKIILGELTDKYQPT